ncbi:MAG: hypothetical protein AVDCRST_MAG45-2475, partial [uncultured Solirubrobacterales bacterium]
VQPLLRVVGSKVELGEEDRLGEHVPARRVLREVPRQPAFLPCPEQRPPRI